MVPIALRYARLLSEDRDDLEAALEVLASAAHRLEPGDDARLFVRAGDLLLAADRPVEALHQLERARELRPRDRAIAERVETARAALDP